MDLESLKTRKAELEIAMTNTSHSFQILSGHKAECDYWIGQIETYEIRGEVEPIAPIQESEVQ